MSTFSPTQIANFHPFNTFSSSQIQQLADSTQKLDFEAGSTILRKHQQSSWAHYLVSGEIEVRSSFFERFNFLATDHRAKFPLEDMAGREAQVNALAPCQIIRFEVDQIERASQLETPPAQAEELLSTIEDQDCLVNDNAFEADWLSEFLHSPLVNHVSARDIQQLLSCIEDIDYPAGSEVVGYGECGDSFYIVKRGLATVHTDPYGPYKGKEFTLMPGAYFGEEALVGNTTRNARVSMETDGTLGRMDRGAFNQFIRDALIVKADSSHLQGVLEEVSDHNVILDVRLYPEYRHGHLDCSRNLPLPALREQLNQLDISKHYYITPEGGPRSELATFLMRQAGFNTVLLREHSDPQ